MCLIADEPESDLDLLRLQKYLCQHLPVKGVLLPVHQDPEGHHLLPDQQLHLFVAEVKSLPVTLHDTLDLRLLVP